MNDPVFHSLVVGVDAPRFVPAELRTRLHIAEPNERRTCPCGRIHAPDDDMQLTLLVGDHDNWSPPTSHLAVMASVAAHQRESELPHVTAPSDVDFDRWVLELTRNLFAPLLIPGVIGYDLPVLVAILHSAPHFELGWTAGNDGLVAQTQRLTEQCDVRPGGLRSAHLMLSAGPDLSLFDVNSAADILSDLLPDSELSFSCYVSDEAEPVDRASLLFARASTAGVAHRAPLRNDKRGSR